MAKPKKLVIGVPRTGEKDESEVRWLMSYSDFMMQLVCLFILLYSVSSLDKGRMARVAAAYRASIGSGDLAAHETKTDGGKLAIGNRSLLGGDLGGGDLPNGLRVRLDPVPGGLRVVFTAPVFDAGSPALTASGGDALDAAARQLRAYAGAAVITAAGDDATDGDPLRLALLRAETVAARLAAQGVDPRFVTTSGAAGRTAARVAIELRME